jgi:hypothetical protein
MEIGRRRWVAYTKENFEVDDRVEASLREKKAASIEGRRAAYKWEQAALTAAGSGN